VDPKPNGPLVGETIAHFRVEAPLGRGGMGEVYRATDLALQRPVALKICSGAGKDGSLLREAQLASSLNHPGIAVVYEVGTFEREGRSEAFIAMEYVPGATLASLRGTLSPSQILDVGIQTAEALAEAHARDIVHRDVKPSNIMVTEGGRVKVLDFGLAKSVPRVDLEAETLSGPPQEFLAGTLAYMAPEQARGLPVDGRTDVYSLGVVLHELFSGRPPFGGRTAVDVLDAVLHASPPPLEVEGERASPALSSLVARMLAKDPEARPRHMADVARFLEALKAGAALPEEPVQAEAGTAVAILTFKNITGRPDDDWLGTGIAETLTTELKALPGITVLSQERVGEILRSATHRGLPEDPSHLAPEARFVVEGAYQRLGDVVRVTAKLTSTADGVVLRTLKLDDTMAAIFELQDSLALALGETLGAEARPRGKDETDVVEAYEAYSKGLVNLKAETHEGLDRAILLFESAVAKDPGYVEAHLQLGIARGLKAEYMGLRDLHLLALESLARVLELRPTLGEAQREKGGILVHLGRVDEGIRAIEEALALDPGDAANHAALGRALFIGKGDFGKAAVAYETSLRLNPRAGWSALQLAHCAALLRDFERGKSAARQAIARQEEFRSGHRGIVLVGAHMRLGHLFALEGRSAEARSEYEKELQFLTKVDHALKSRIFIELHMRLGASLLASGETLEGRAALEMAIDAFERRVRLGGDEPATRYYAAAAYALAGDAAAALDSLEKAIRGRRAFTVARARIEPEFLSLRGDPRFQALVQD
jgi:serine/threonine protein kinase/tetratricopeptide (TPR) repeat protein